MSASATQLLDALVAHLTVDPAADPPDERFSQEFTPARSWLAVGDLQDNGARVELTHDAWRPLGQAGTLRLEQHIVAVILQARATGVNTTANAAIDPYSQLREELHDALLNWSDDEAGFRVAGVLNPAPYDRSKLTSPGLFVSRLLLDCEVLRSVGTEPEPEAPDPLPLLTRARTAVWDAIDAWPAFTVDDESVWARKYVTDLDVAELMLRDPAPHELPALALTWGTFAPDAFVHRMKEWPIALTLTAWLPATQEAIAQQRAQDLIEAVYQSTKAGETIPAVKNELRQFPKGIRGVSVTPTQLGRDGLRRAVRVEVQIELRAQHDPFGSLP